MALLGGTIGYRLLRTIAPVEPSRLKGDSYSGRSKVEAHFGCGIWRTIQQKTVIDYGCGDGTEAIELAKRGAGRVYGVDIMERRLEKARQKAKKARCTNVVFCNTAAERADVIFSIDGFEHFSDPALILEEMAHLLKPGGSVYISFGPTWYHPLGGHLFSIFPWAHLIFGEAALCRWRSHIRSDGAQKFSEVEGGLNRMTIGRFESLIRSSGLQPERFDAVPIRSARLLHNRITQELFTSVVRCKLTPRMGAEPELQEEFSLTATA